MAGFFVVLGDIKKKDKVIKSAREVLIDLCRDGVYSTNLPYNKGVKKWAKSKLSTFADYFGMKANDYIFFFYKRKIYGIGQLKNIADDCKYWVYQGANICNKYSNKQIQTTKLWKNAKPDNRVICFFEPVKYYSHAVDMDEALTAFPGAFKSLRVLQGKSFIKLDDEEAMALFAVLNRCGSSVNKEDNVDWEPPTFSTKVHDVAKKLIKKHPDYYSFTIKTLLTNNNKQCIQDEMLIEAAIVDCINKKEGTSLWGDWKYVTHQMAASPAKPVEYMEWIDVYGYSCSSYLIEKKIPIQFAIEQYYVMEIKKEALNLPIPKRGKETKSNLKTKMVANQLMKYVDWVAKNLASGNYPMVKAFLVANDFDDEFIKYCKTVCVRNYNDGYRDSIPAIWSNVELIKYSFDGISIKFERVPVEQ